MSVHTPSNPSTSSASNQRQAQLDDKLTKVEAELDETKAIMQNTIEAVLDQGDNIDDLVAKSDRLAAHSSTFTKTAMKTNPKKRPAQKRRKRNVETPFEVDDSVSNTETLQRLMKNLNIRFTNCTFTYKTVHFAAEKEAKKNGKSLRTSIVNTFHKFRESIAPDQTFDKCLFVPVGEEKDVKNFLQKDLPGVGLSFENCKFIKRSSTINEKIRRKLRNIFGIQFELEYIHATVIIDQYKFRVKDTMPVYQHIQQRIAEEG